MEKGGEKDPQMILDTIAAQRVTHINFVPSMFNVFVNMLNQNNIRQLSGLKYLFLAGEAIVPESVIEFRRLNSTVSTVQVENLYGPTEATVYTSKYSLSCWEEKNNVPIGNPIQNVQLFVINRYNKLQALGISGEMGISGVGLARGYLNNPELTNNSFSDNPFIPGERMYKTGDLARWLPGGNIEFLGRMDQQVKVRGFRIELGEIETQLLNHDEIKEAVVIAKEDNSGGKYLCAYIVTRKAQEQKISTDFSEIKKNLSENLPGYMIPAFYVTLEKIPLTSSGKINRKALPAPEVKIGADTIAPRNAVEEKLAGLWSEVLGIKNHLIGIDSNFFKLGGHSLKAIVLTDKMHKTFDVKVPLKEIFNTPYIRGLAEHIKNAIQNKYQSIEPAEKQEYYSLSSAQKRLYILQQMHPESTAYNMPMIFALPGKFDVEKLKNILKKLINHHESLRTSFHMVENEMVQKVHDEADFTIENYRAAVGDKVEDIVKTFIHPFNLIRAPLIKVGLLRIHDGQNLLTVDMHHIISDGVSQEILKKDFQALSQGKTLPPFKIQYKDFSEWQNSEEEKNKIKQQEVYWLKEFEGEIPLLNMPTDYVRPKVLSFTGDSVYLNIDQPLTREIKKLASRLEVTLMMLLISVYKILLSKYSGQEELVVGTVITGRVHADLENIMGFFVNMLPIKTRPEENKKFSEYVKELKEKAIHAYENQEYQFEEMVSKLELQRQPGRHSLVDVVFVFLDETSQTVENKNLEKKSGNLDPRKVSHFDLMLHVTDRKDSIGLVFEYSTVLYKESTIKKFANSYVEILEQLLANQNLILKEINISLNLLPSTSNVIQNDNDEWDL